MMVGPVRLEIWYSAGTSDFATQPSGGPPLLTVFQFQKDDLETMTNQMEINCAESRFDRFTTFT